MSDKHLAERFRQHMRDAEARDETDKNEVWREFAKRGALKSSMTINAYRKRMTANAETAVQECLDTISAKTRKAGAARSKMLDALAIVIDVHIAGRQEELQSAFLKMGLQSSSMIGDMSDASARCNRLVEDYRAEWTAPSPKSWLDEHPFVEKLLLLLIGAAAGAVLTALVD